MKKLFTGFGIFGLSLLGFNTSHALTEGLEIQQNIITIEKADQVRGEKYARPGVRAFRKTKRNDRHQVKRSRGSDRRFAGGLKFKHKSSRVRTKAPDRRNFRHQKFNRRVRF